MKTTRAPRSLQNVVTEDAVDQFMARVFAGKGSYAEALVVAAMWAASDRRVGEKLVDEATK